MKIVVALLLVGVLLSGLMGCGRVVEDEQAQTAPPVEEPAENHDIPAFSFEAVEKQFTENTPGVKTDGFRNVIPCPMEGEKDAVERAKAECTVEYDSVRVRYDRAADMWEVCFLPNHPGGGQDVYLNGEGVTQLIIYGE